MFNETSGYCGGSLRAKRHFGLRSSLARFVCLSLAATTAVLALGTTSAPDAEDYTPGGDWQTYNKTLDAQRYSPLTQINTGNAASLAEVCRTKIAEHGAFQAGLIVIGSTMYATTGTDTIALDAATCEVKWRHVYHRSQNAILPINRGVAYANGRLFRGTDDGRLIALNAQTGAELWTDVVGDARLGEWVSAAPVAWNGLVIAGTAAGEFGIRGRVMAFDAATGREIWRFYTIPVGKEIGADTWIDTHWNQHGGGGTWSSFTVDPTTSEIFVPVGNPVPDFTPADRPGQNLFSNSVVALDGTTGRLKWWYQTKDNDAQDNDLAAAPVLYRDGKNQERVAVGGKDGYLHIIDRETHKLIAKTAVTTVDAKQQAPSTTGVKMCPGPAGGVEWNGPGFDPVHQTLFVGAVDYCAIFKSNPGSVFTPGGLNYGGTWTPTSDTATGWITAVDAGTGKIKWKYHAEAPVLSGITPTAGGIVLGGDNAGNFLVLDSVTGSVIKKVATGGSLSGGVITYEQKGKQYIAFTSGNISRTVFGAAGRPTIVVMAVPGPVTSVVAQTGGSDIGHGRQVFYGMCAGCHGSDGKNISINGHDLTTVKQRMSVEQIVAWIKNPKPPMPKVFPEPLQPSEEADLRDVATFLHEWPN
jgi:PQQ-dependent dehydrogenase (methanol/ethanol family)